VSGRRHPSEVLGLCRTHALVTAWHGQGILGAVAARVGFCLNPPSGTTANAHSQEMQRVREMEGEKRQLPFSRFLTFLEERVMQILCCTSGSGQKKVENSCNPSATNLSKW
jgi:hypothetical protein